jgi:hypothetical protein
MMSSSPEIAAAPGADAPRADEIVVAVAVPDGGRPHPRIGGLQVGEIRGEDGLR